jgi:hypothetical protein
MTNSDPDWNSRPTTEQKVKLEHLLWAAGGLLTGAWWVKNQHDEAKKSRAEKDDPDGVKEVCNTFGPLLDEWEPEEFETEDDYVQDLFDYLVDDTDETEDEDETEEEEETDFEIEMRPSTPEGQPDILIHDRLAIEVKVDLSKADRDRLIGQTAGYSREWVTWIVLINTSESRVGALERLLAAKGLEHILVFAFT